jgi:hypothetical protein
MNLSLDEISGEAIFLRTTSDDIISLMTSVAANSAQISSNMVSIASHSSLISDVTALVNNVSFINTLTLVTTNTN